MAAVGDLASIFKQAQGVAAQQEEQANELLWGHLAQRAARDETFRQALTAKPEQIVKEEAQKLKISLAPAQIEKAKELFGSPVLPGIDRTKVEALIFGTIEDVRRSFNMTLQLARALFVVGLVLLVVSAVFTFTKGATAGAIFGGGGIVSLIVSLVMNPLDRIRNAGANLVQVQMAYLAYYNLLYLLGTRGDNLPFNDAKQYASELRQAAESMVTAVQGILDRGGTRLSVDDLALPGSRDQGSSTSATGDAKTKTPGT